MIRYLIMGNNTVHQHMVDFEGLCREHRIHCTGQRKQIWEYFASDAQGRTIAEAVVGLAPCGIGRATIYRTIELFERLRLLTCLRDIAGKQRFSAVCPGHTHALICQSCHQVVEFDDCDLSMLEKLLMAKTGFSINGHHLEVYGICPACTGV